MDNYKKIQKGTVIGNDWYYVVVESVIYDNTLYLHCICDNANNVYTFSIDEVLKSTHESWIIMTPLMAVKVANWSCFNELSEEDQEIFNRINRSIPLEVIAEVLSGKHDNRWY